MEPTIKEATFVSIHTNGGLRRRCEYSSELLEVFYDETLPKPDGDLVQEYIEFEDGTILDVCMVCHCHVLSEQDGTCCDLDCPSHG